MPDPQRRKRKLILAVGEEEIENKQIQSQSKSPGKQFYRLPYKRKPPEFNLSFQQKRLRRTLKKICRDLKKLRGQIAYYQKLLKLTHRLKLVIMGERHCFIYSNQRQKLQKNRNYSGEMIDKLKKLAQQIELEVQLLEMGEEELIDQKETILAKLKEMYRITLIR